MIAKPTEELLTTQPVPYFKIKRRVHEEVDPLPKDHARRRVLEWMVHAAENVIDSDAKERVLNALDSVFSEVTGYVAFGEPRDDLDEANEAILKYGFELSSVRRLNSSPQGRFARRYCGAESIGMRPETVSDYGLARRFLTSSN